jgi:hypothetical protein
LPASPGGQVRNAAADTLARWCCSNPEIRCARGHSELPTRQRALAALNNIIVDVDLPGGHTSASAASSFIGGIDAKICARSESPKHTIRPERPLTHDDHQQSPNEIADADLTAAWHFGQQSA